MKKIDLPNLPRIEIKSKGPSKKAVLAEVLVGAAIAAGITYAVKKLIDQHHAKEAKPKKRPKKRSKS